MEKKIIFEEDFQGRINQINNEIELVLAEKAKPEADYSNIANSESFFQLAKAAMVKVVREWDKLDQQKNMRYYIY